jgi:glucans biosynthesis protein
MTDAPALGPALGPSKPFTATTVLDMARELAKRPFTPPPALSQEALAGLDYDEYRAIRYRPEASVWNADRGNFTLQMFHAGYIYKTPVPINVVEGGQAAPLLYDPSLFTYGPKLTDDIKKANGGFSGFRIHSPVNRADLYDEFVVFQGASYFRSRASGQDYGISARGLALNTAKPPADEFPVFREFWVEKPAAGDKQIKVHALLDSASVAGAYTFVISNRYITVMDVACTLFPRQTLSYPGIAPLTSMFFFAPSNNLRVDEVRPRVHDSDGLLVVNGANEHIWRPLINGKRIESSSFYDNKPKGFGLVQRERRPDRYEDFDARYDLRPTLWVEPKGDWGEGSVDLIELPTQNEYADNIVAYWRPRAPMEAGKSYSFEYTLTWCYEPPVSRNLATVAQTLVGASTQREGLRLFYIDFIGTEQFDLCDEDDVNCKDKLKNVELSASSGAIVNVAFRRNRLATGHRLGFEYAPAANTLGADLRCQIVSGGKTVSEVWIYRWTA